MRDTRVIFSLLVLQIEIIFTLMVAPDHYLLTSTYPTLYGALWALLNPFYHSATVYPWVTVFWEVVSYAIGLTLCIKGRLRWKFFMWAQMTNILWAEMQWTQNITITTFAPLVEVFPIFILFMIAQKFPLGWSLSLSDSHWQSYFALGPTNFSTVCTGLDYHAWCANWQSLAPIWWYQAHHAVAYAFLAFWFIVPLAMYFHDSLNCWWLDPRKVFWYIVMRIVSA